MSYPTETFCAVLQVQNYTDIAAIPEGREWEICANTVTRTIGFPRKQRLMHFNENQKETTPHWFSGTHSTIYLKFLKDKMRNRHATALHSWSSQLFAKISAATFWMSAFTHLQMGEKAVQCCICRAGSWTKQAQLGWESRGPHTATLVHLPSKKNVSYKLRKKSKKQICLIYCKEEALGARKELIRIEWNYHPYSLHTSLHTQKKKKDSSEKASPSLSCVTLAQMMDPRAPIRYCRMI